jgi:hypothetical protein
MAILKQQIDDFLRLEGHLPEKFLLVEVLGRTEAEADTILEWRHQEIMQMHPAVMDIKLLAERAKLRKALGLPPVENEELEMHKDGVKVTQLKGRLVPDEDGNPTLEGADSVPAGLREAFKAQLMKELLDDGKPTGIAHFSGPDGPGEVKFPNGEVRQYRNMLEFVDAIARGEVPGIGPNQGEEDEDEDDENN